MKPATAKAKGRETENFFVDYLARVWSIVTERRRLTGVEDKGDIAKWKSPVWGEVCVEVKSGASLSVPQWIRELEAEKRNSGANIGVIAVRPKGKPDPKDWWAIMPLPEAVRLIEQLEVPDES